MSRMLSPILALLGLLAIVAPLHAQGFEVPEGFVGGDATHVTRSPDWQAFETVRPADGPFSELSEIVLARVNGPVADSDAWLARRLSAEVTTPAEVAKLLDSPDSPFADPAFDALRRALPELFAGLQKMGELPLEFCDPPITGYNAAGEFRERYCTFAIGPLRKFVVLRLQQAGGDWYYTTITTMNERRLRHLVAIANSFSTER
jgi:hypothetical protein